MQANGIRIDSTVREHAVLTMGMSTLEIMLVESDRDRASVTLQMETCMLVIGRRILFMDLEDIIIIMAIGTLMFDHLYLLLLHSIPFTYSNLTKLLATSASFSFEGMFRGGKRNGRGKYQLTDGRVEIYRYVNDARVGDGVRWSANRKKAWRMNDGKVTKRVSIEEAAAIAKRCGPLVEES